MTLPVMGAHEGEPSALDRAAAIEQIAATLAELSPANDLARGLRLLEPFPGDPAALEAAAQHYRDAARGIARIAVDLEAELAQLSARWHGPAATAATASGQATAGAATADAARFDQVAAALAELAAGLRADHAALGDVVEALAALGIGLTITGPLAPPAREAAIAALIAGAALLRRVHQRDHDTTTVLRRILADTGAPLAPETPTAPVPADGGRLPGLDAPAPGQSGVQYGWGGITTVTLNDADTGSLSSALGYAAGGAGIATLLGALAPPVAVALGVAGGEAVLTNQLIKDHRTPAGVRLTFLGAQPIAASGR